jgi:cyclophilin family peptidyl-prolyl cis-trans isomerase
MMISTCCRAIALALLLFSSLVLADPRVTLETNYGNIVLELDAKKAPGTVANFLQYAREGFYDGTIFHRVIGDFMIQGGGFTEDFKQKPTHPPIANEASNGLKNSRGSIAMARTSDPHSATAQFFINVKDNPSLDYPGQDGFGYAVFGKVIEGMDVVDKIRQAPTGVGGPGMRDVPKDAVIIKKVTVTDTQDSKTPTPQRE